MRVCSCCKVAKDRSGYFAHPRTFDGLQAACKECKRKKDREAYRLSQTRRASVQDRREIVRGFNRRLMQRYKGFCGCKLCSESEPVALDLHHLDMTTKEHNPANMVSFSTEAMKGEIRKCVVLCANCHRKVHAGLVVL